MLYGPYGELLNITGDLATTLGAANPLRYRGYYYDAELEMYYLQSRYYDPTAGRFINGDTYASTGQGVLGCNMFAYCGNNPVCYSDPTGQYSRELAKGYAEDYYEDPNENYYFYTRGDCANFVSQCLRAGGLSDNSEWYHKERTKKPIWEIILNPLSWFQPKRRYNWSSSKSWRLANEQYKYFSDSNNGYINGDVLIIASVDDIEDVANNGGVQIGDLLYFSRDGINANHATIITKVDDGMIYYAAHTSSKFDEPLSNTIGSNTIFIIRINDDA